MAAYTIAAAEVVAADANKLKTGIGAAAIAIGQAIYRVSSTGRFGLAQADGTAEEAQFAGIAVSACSAAGQPFHYVDEGDIQLDTAALTGAALGDIVVLGATAGSLYPSGDLGTGDFVTVCGFIKHPGAATPTPAVMTIKSIWTGVELPA